VRRVAQIDLSAFSRNLRALLARDEDLVLDARADAFGHSAALIVPAAMAAGVSTIRVSPNHTEIPGIARSALMTVPSRRRLVGAQAYGLDESGTLTPVMTLIGEVISVKAVEAGAGVSYGYSYRTSDATTLALVALGYADGIPRLASNLASVFVGGATHPLVGRVAMDQFVVECGSSAPTVGDEAVLFGVAESGHPLASEWAAQTRRSALELTANLGSRVERVAV
jgi:alanine racemase